MLAVHNPKTLLAICEEAMAVPFGSLWAVTVLLKLSLKHPELFLSEEEYMSKHNINLGGDSAMT